MFRGSISEYPGVIVDHFVPANCERGRFFFLSHCHRGLCVCGSLAHLAAGLPAACCVSLHYCCSCCMHTLCMEYICSSYIAQSCLELSRICLTSLHHTSFPCRSHDRPRLTKHCGCSQEMVRGLLPSKPKTVATHMRVCTHRKTNLLCSEVTQSLLLKDPEFTGLAPYLRALPMEEPIVMSLEASGAHEVCT